MYDEQKHWIELTWSFDWFILYSNIIFDESFKSTILQSVIYHNYTLKISFSVHKFAFNRPLWMVCQSVVAFDVYFRAHVIFSLLLIDICKLSHTNTQTYGHIYKHIRMHHYPRGKQKHWTCTRDSRHEQRSSPLIKWWNVMWKTFWDGFYANAHWHCDRTQRHFSSIHRWLVRWKYYKALEG